MKFDELCAFHKAFRKNVISKIKTKEVSWGGEISFEENSKAA